MIHFRKTQILKGKMLQTSNGALRRHRPEAHEVQQLVKFSFFHEFLPRSLGLGFAHELSQRLIVRVNAPLCNESIADHNSPSGWHLPELVG